MILVIVSICLCSTGCSNLLARPRQLRALRSRTLGSAGVVLGRAVAAATSAARMGRENLMLKVVVLMVLLVVENVVAVVLLLLAVENVMCEGR
jgi:hypothetical protein